MTQLNEVYKCEVCGNIVEVVHSGQGELSCCEQPMTLQKPKTKKDEGLEKHVPVIEAQGDQTLIKVGSTEHPMKEEHYIEWIEIFTKDNKIGRIHLKPNQKPQALFDRKAKDIVMVREYCNLHGLWKYSKKQ